MKTSSGVPCRYELDLVLERVVVDGVDRPVVPGWRVVEGVVDQAASPLARTGSEWLLPSVTVPVAGRSRSAAVPELGAGAWVGARRRAGTAAARNVGHAGVRRRHAAVPFRTRRAGTPLRAAPVTGASGASGAA